MIDPITGEFHYEPRWQGPLSGRSFEKQTEDAINYLRRLISESLAGIEPSDLPPQAPGVADPGISAQYSRGDHVHPGQTTITGNAGSATKLKTSRNITLEGDASGTAAFNGTRDAIIDVTIPAATNNAKGLMSAEDKQKLDNIEAGANNYVLPQATTNTLGGVYVDAALNANSQNPVQNSAIVASMGQTVTDIQTWASGNSSGLVHTTEDELIDGTKVFIKPIDGSVTGSASTITSVLPISKGGTGSSTKNFVDLTTNQSISGAKSFAQGPYGATNAVSASEINLHYGCVFTKIIAANTTFTFTGAPTGKAATFNLVLTNGGAYTITWPASIKWSSGNPPDLTTSGIDVLTFMTPDGGSTWYGTVALEGAA